VVGRLQNFAVEKGYSLLFTQVFLRMF